MRARVEESHDPVRLGGVAQVLADRLQLRLRSEVRAVVIGHVQRGGPPTASDRVLATRYGSAAADLVREGAWGSMVTLEHGRIARTELARVAGQTRRVPLDHELLRCMRGPGVSLGVTLGEAEGPSRAPLAGQPA